VNVLNKEKGMPSAAIKQSIKNLFSLPLLLKEPTPAIVEQTIEIMEKYRITAYDALFVATAKDADCQLLSADRKGHGKITDSTVVMLEDYHS